MNKTLITLSRFISVAALCVWSSTALSQDGVKPDTDIAELEVAHDAAQIEAMMVPSPVNPVIDTVLSFSRPEAGRALIRCIGYNLKGEATGRARAVVYGNGVAFILASDLASQGPGRFVGSVRCHSTAEVVPTAYLTGPYLEPLEATTRSGWNRDELYFPVVATL